MKEIWFNDDDAKIVKEGEIIKVRKNKYIEKGSSYIVDLDNLNLKKEPYFQELKGENEKWKN